MFALAIEASGPYRLCGDSALPAHQYHLQLMNLFRRTPVIAALSLRINAGHETSDGLLYSCLLNVPLDGA